MLTDTQGGDPMHRLVLTSAVAAVAALLVAGPALAFQCPKLIAQINAAAGNRFDAASNSAKEKAASAQKLHAEGKHAESEKAAKEGLQQLGIKM
jgi:hypothetical protein